MSEVIHLEEYAARQVELLGNAIAEVQQERAQLNRVHNTLVERRIMWIERMGHVAVAEPIDYQPPLFEMGEL